MRFVPGHQQRAPVLQQAEMRVHPDRLVAVPLQLEFVDHLGPQQAHGVRGDGVAIAGMELLGHRGAAEHGAPLEHERPQARAAEVGGGGEAVVAAADDDGIPDFAHALTFTFCKDDMPMSLRSAIPVFAATALALLAGSAVALDAAGAAKPTVVPLLAKDVPEFAGKEITVATVEYLPGGASASHRHHAHVVVYVLEGRYATQVAGGERLVLGPGETFYENPADEHVVSENASATEPVKILVFMLKDKQPAQ